MTRESAPAGGRQFAQLTRHQEVDRLLRSDFRSSNEVRYAQLAKQSMWEIRTESLTLYPYGLHVALSGGTAQKHTARG